MKKMIRRMKKLLVALMTVSLLMSMLCVSAMAGKTDVTIFVSEGENDNPFHGKDVTVSVDGKEVGSGKGSGNHVNIDLGTEDNTLDTEKTIVISATGNDGETISKEYTISVHQEQGKGQHGYDAQLKSNTPATDPEKEPEKEPEPTPVEDTGDDDDDVTITDEDVPLTALPDAEVPLTEGPLSEIPEEEVPLAAVPKTGDMSVLWLALSALSGTGLAGVSLLGRKKREDEE